MTDDAELGLPEERVDGAGQRAVVRQTADEGSTRPADARPSARVTMSDVAAVAGVSTTTVSHALSGRQPVSTSALERVRQAVSHLGYRANPAARGLATGRSFILGVHVPYDVGDVVINPFFTTVVLAISATASAEGYGLILLPAGEQAASRQAETLLAGGRIDGAVLITPGPAGQLVETLEAAALPLVSIGKIAGRPEHGWVDGDVVAQTREALDHLVAQGYSRIALLTVAGRQSFLVELMQSYRAWCEEHGRRPVVLESDALSEAASIRKVESAWASFDALLCAHDLLAVGAAHAVAAGDRKVGVVGNGDSFFARGATVPLTSVATFPEEKGQRATRLLLALIDGQRRTPEHVVVPHELVVRASSRVLDGPNRPITGH